MGKVRVAMLDVISLDGKLTHGDISDVHEWSSPEDAAHFRTTMRQYKAVVMGRTTYDKIQPDPEPGKLRIVLTTRPEAFANSQVPGQLEFMKASPDEVITIVSERGYDELLLLGGGATNGEFLAAGVVDEAFITLEPWMFGTGAGLTGDAAMKVHMRLISCKQLNSRGTLLLHYTIDNAS